MNFVVLKRCTCIPKSSFETCNLRLENNEVGFNNAEKNCIDGALALQLNPFNVLFNHCFGWNLSGIGAEKCSSSVIKPLLENPDLVWSIYSYWLYGSAFNGCRFKSIIYRTFKYCKMLLTLHVWKEKLKIILDIF